MSAAKHSATIPFGPSAPELTARNLLDQFWADVYGKEVQTTATYSYTWWRINSGTFVLVSSATLPPPPFAAW
jgi:exonuclease III